MNDFKRVAGITSYQHFHFSSEFPGKVKMSKTHCSDEVTTLQLVKDPEKVFSADDLPPLLAPAGLSDHRRKYLQDNILHFFISRTGRPSVQCWCNGLTQLSHEQSLRYILKFSNFDACCKLVQDHFHCSFPHSCYSSVTSRSAM